MLQITSCKLIELCLNRNHYVTECVNTGAASNRFATKKISNRVYTCKSCVTGAMIGTYTCLHLYYMTMDIYCTRTFGSRGVLKQQ